MGPPFPIPFRGKITANIYEISPGHLLLTSREIVFYCLTHWGPYSPFPIGPLNHHFTGHMENLRLGSKDSCAAEASDQTAILGQYFTSESLPPCRSAAFGAVFCRDRKNTKARSQRYWG